MKLCARFGARCLFKYRLTGLQGPQDLVVWKSKEYVVGFSTDNILCEFKASGNGVFLKAMMIFLVEADYILRIHCTKLFRAVLTTDLKERYTSGRGYKAGSPAWG